MAEVLIVAGDKSESMSLAQVLQQAGFGVRTFGAAAEALRGLEHAPADLILYDLYLPGDDHFELCRSIKSNGRFARVTVAGHSRQVDPSRILRCLEAGADGFLSLARPAAELVAAVGRIVARGPRTASTDGGRVLISFRGQPYALGIDREHLLDVLVSTFDDFHDVNEHLKDQIVQRDKSEQYARMIVDSAYDACLGMDADGRIVTWNPRAEEIFGWSRAEALGQAVAETIIPPRHRAGHWSGLQRFLKTGQGRVLNKNLQMTALHRDGREFPIELTISAIKLENTYRFHAFVRDITERKRAEEELRASEARFRDLFENASDLIQSVAPDGSYRYVNPAWRAAMGYTEDEVARLRLPQVLHRDCLGECMEMFQKLMRGESLGRIQAKFVTKDGRTIEVEGNTSVHFEDGKPQATRGVFRDVTERNRVEAELRKQREFIDAVLDCTDAGIVVCDPQGRIVLFNRMLREIHGLPNDSVPPEEWAQHFDLYKPDGRTQLRLKEVPLFRAMRGEHVDSEEVVIAPKNQPRRTVLVSASPIMDGGGQRLGAVLSLHDISERKRAEEELRKREAQLREFNRVLMDLAVHDSILGSNMNLAMSHFTQTVARSLNVARCSVWLLNLDQTDLVCFDLYETAKGVHANGADIDPRSCPGYFRALEAEQIVAADDARADPRTRELTDGYLTPFGITSMLDGPLRLGGRVVGALCNEHVGPPRKWSQEEQNFAVSVASLISLTLEANERKQAEEEARAARDAAEAANRAKSSFLANMSHEIRTPMNAIIGMTELALDTQLNAEQRDYLELVRKSADNLLGIINEILDFSKIEAGRLELETIEFNLHELVGDVLSTLAPRAWQKGLELAGRVAPEVPEILDGDPVRLRQVLVNLVGNAIKFTENGEIYVEVRPDPDAGSGARERLRFLVRDSGIGVPKDKQGLIFDPFTQADSTTTRKYGGTGLGLTISSRLVSLMGGQIWVESEPGEGSVFVFTAAFGRPASTVRAEPARTWDEVRGLAVLVVDDNATNRRILEESLKQWNMKPTMADGGAPALAALDRAKNVGEPFALVILDVQMPGMDGFELAEAIKARPELTGATIMMLTSGGRPGDAARCRELGIAAYMTKPVRQADLRRAIQMALGSAPREQGETLAAAEGSDAVRPLRILLAEDNPVNQKLAIRLLEKRGHWITVANNGREALELWERDPFDMILMDVQMPVLDGLSTATAIREREPARGTHIPILAMTAYAMKGDRDRCLDAGMDDYVSKPIRSEELCAAIARLAGGKSEAAPRPSVNGSPVDQLRQLVAWDEALSYVGDDVDLLRDLTGTFLEECPSWLANLDAALNRNDPPAVQEAAHPFKNSLQLLGAKAAGDLVYRLEKMGRDQKLEGADDLRKALEVELKKLLPALRRFASVRTT